MFRVLEVVEQHRVSSHVKGAGVVGSKGPLVAWVRSFISGPPFPVAVLSIDVVWHLFPLLPSTL